MLQIPLSLLQKLNEANSWQDFLKFVENVTVIEGEEEGDQLTVVGAWETVDGISSLKFVKFYLNLMKS